ncbi:MAG TPA: SAM-dependent methyltransferase [Parachlamydiaceae bacterium]|nr:SAM-dependent methyltransferase [Parachlamydiaceae bacterium]
MSADIFEWTKIILLILPLIAILLSLVAWTIINGISPMPTSAKAKSCMLSLLPPEFHGKIYELGSGWGTLLFPIARRYPDSQIIGFETSHIPFWFSSLCLKVTKCSNVKLYRKDFFSVDLSDASLVVCYLYPGAMKKLKSKFESELQPGTYVISNTFAVPGWIPEKKMDAGDLYHNNIYLYRIP